MTSDALFVILLSHTEKNVVVHGHRFRAQRLKIALFLIYIKECFKE